jgi:two-component system sporulation sensor kinase A
MMIGVILLKSHVKSFCKRLLANISFQGLSRIKRAARDASECREVEERLQTLHQELKETVRYQQGIIFKFKKVNDRFIYTLCDGELLYRLGLRPEEVIGRELKYFFTPEEAAVILHYYESAWQSEDYVVFEGYVRGIAHLTSLTPIKRNGRVVEVIGSCIDITDRKRTEEALMEAEVKYRSLVEDAQIGVYMFQDGRYIYVNPHYAKIFGYTQEEILQMNPFDLVVEEDREFAIKKTMEKVAGINKDVNYHIRGIKKDGSRIELEGHGKSTTYNGRPAIIGTVLDVTEKMRTEETLRENDKRYHRWIKLLPEPIFVHTSGNIIYVNNAGIKLVGAKEQEEVIGMSIFDFIHPDDHDVVRKRIEWVTQTDNHLEFMELKLKRLDGQVIEVESSGIYIYKYSSTTPVIQTVMRDITERKRTEAMLRKSEKLSVVGQLAAGVAHEIRNPLTSLKGFSQLLKTKIDVHHEYLDIMLSELDRINFIVNEFMLLSKPQTVLFKEKNVKDILHNIVSLLETQAILGSVEIVTEIEGDIPWIRCDENQLKQVFINLIKNSLEAMPQGGQLTIQAMRQSPGHILIRIVDQGFGIPKDRLPRIGEPFFTTKENGTGLGLMVSSKIIESHQGKMNVCSEVGHGTTVEVILPVCESDYAV